MSILNKVLGIPKKGLEIFRCQSCGKWRGDWEWENAEYYNKVLDMKCKGHKMTRTSQLSIFELIAAIISYKKYKNWKKA